MNCSELDAALSAVCADTFTPSAPPGYTKYITWAVYGYTLVRGDDAAAVRIPRVQIDAYCQDPDAAEDGGFFAAVMDALDGLGLAYEVQDVIYDPDAEALRLIIQCDVA